VAPRQLLLLDFPPICVIALIFILILLLPVGQAGEAYKYSNKSNGFPETLSVYDITFIFQKSDSSVEAERTLHAKTFLEQMSNHCTFFFYCAQSI
jgi:hypothetical protein